jgi:hypothetical protein
MLRKITAAAVSAALCLAPVTPAFAQNVAASELQAPLGATATLNLRVPLGNARNTQEPTYGLRLGYGHLVGSRPDGQALTRQVRMADIRFSSDGVLRQANVASFDLANLDKDRRFDGLTGGGASMWLIVGAVAGAVAICTLADCFGGDDDDEIND